jgi:hypothetical protein
LRYETVGENVIHGRLELLAASAIRDKNIPVALQYIEIGLRDVGKTLERLRGYVPDSMAGPTAKVSNEISEYQIKFQDKDTKQPIASGSTIKH